MMLKQCSRAVIQSGEAGRKRNWDIRIAKGFQSEKLKLAFKNKFIIEDPTDEQIEKYLVEAKKDGYDEESFGRYIKEVRNGFKTVSNPTDLVPQMKELDELKKSNKNGKKPADK